MFASPVIWKTHVNSPLKTNCPEPLLSVLRTFQPQFHGVPFVANYWLCNQWSRRYILNQMKKVRNHSFIYLQFRKCPSSIDQTCRKIVFSQLKFNISSTLIGKLQTNKNTSFGDLFWLVGHSPNETVIDPYLWSKTSFTSELASKDAIMQALYDFLPNQMQWGQKTTFRPFTKFWWYRRNIFEPMLGLQRQA